MESVGPGLFAQLAAKSGLAILTALGACGLARKLQRLRPAGASDATLRVVESAVIAPNRSVHIVAVGRRAFLLASTPNQVLMLGEVTSELPTEQTETPARPVAFASALARLLPPATAGDRQTDWLEVAAHALRRQAGGSARA